jgi:hypothetical protein
LKMALKQKPKKKAGGKKKVASLRLNAGAGSAHSSASDAAASHRASSSVSDIDDMTLLKSPLKTSFLFARICVHSTIDAARHHAFIAVALTAIAVAGYVDVQLRTKDLSGGSFDFREDLSIAGIMYWVGLGFLSSFGMGFGLHTFVLFLAPAIIAHVSHYPQHSILQNYREVWWWALSWGVGTAIGELPPYWAARAARLQNKRSAELDEEFASTADSGVVGRIKHRIQGMNMGFVSICLFASVPNPLFDLAGLMCGHNLVPFRTFFGATAVRVCSLGNVCDCILTTLVVRSARASSRPTSRRFLFFPCSTLEPKARAAALALRSACLFLLTACSALVTELLRSHLPATAFLKMET